MTIDTHARDEIARQISTFDEVRSRHPKVNLWFFDSPKNNCRLSLKGELAFYISVLLEGEPSVTSYLPAESANDRATQSIGVHYDNGTAETWAIRRKRPSSKDAEGGADDLSKNSLASGPVVWKSDEHIRGREIAIDNWLLLCAAITRCRNFRFQREQDMLKECMKSSDSASLGELLTTTGADPALMLGVVARALQKGLIRADLDRELVAHATVLSWGTSK